MTAVFQSASYVTNASFQHQLYPLAGGEITPSSVLYHAPGRCGFYAMAALVIEASKCHLKGVVACGVHELPHSCFDHN